MENRSHVLFLNSAAGIWAHTATDSLILNRLARSGAKVSSISCDGYLRGLCAVRLSRGRTLEQVNARKDLDCRDCRFTANLTSLAGNIDSINRFELGKFISNESRKEVEDYFFSWQTLGFPLDFNFRGLPVPRLAGYEISLKYKSWEVAIEGLGSEEFHRAVFDAALTVSAASKFFSSYKDFSTVIIRSPQYANNGAFARVARANGIRVLFLDGSPNIAEDYTHLMIWDWAEYGSSNPANRFFTGQPVTLAPKSLERIESHLKALKKGISHKAYSPAKQMGVSPLGVMGAKMGKPTAVLALSSTDETEAARQSGVIPGLNTGIVFRDQFEWVRETIEWFEQRPHLQLVIRVHPREFPNKRESRTSPAAHRWETALSQVPANVYLNHPNQGLSLYDLFDEIQVLVTGWSSAGLEAALQGVKLVTYDSSLPGYPATIGLTGSSREEYFSNLHKALLGAENIPYRENALAWLDHLMNIGTTRVGGRFLASKRNLLPRWFGLILEGLDRYFYLIYRPLDLLRGILFESTDKKYERIIFEGKKSFYE